MSTPLERAEKLRKQADELMETIQLAELCRGIGPLTPTGSYYLDLMIYPDIDVYVPPAQPSQLFKIVSELSEHHPVVKVNYLNAGAGPLKDGRYIKPVIAYGDWERPWKIDIWAIDQAFIDEKQAELKSLKDRITPEIRALILNYKFSVLDQEFRTPRFSGHYIYQAVLDHGLTDFSAITEYLRAHKIEI